MWTAGLFAALAVLLALGGAAATAFRSALLVLGEEGLAAEAARGDARAAALLGAVRDEPTCHPFSLWIGATALKVLAGLAAGAAAYIGATAIGGWGGAAAGAGWAAAFLVLLFLLESAAARSAVADPRRVIGRGSACLLALALAAPPARLADRFGRALFGATYSPEALMDIRFRSEEGILDVIEEGAEHGTIDSTEERMIEGVLRFGQMSVGEGMTPWSEVVTLRAGRPFGEVTGILAATGFSRYPVVSAAGDEVLGILPTRTLIGPDGPDRWARIASSPERLLERPVYVPQSMRVSDLFRQFRRTRVHLAVAIDEHGRLGGVITLHDLLERIVGRMAEGEQEGEAPEWEKDGALSVPASVPVRILRDEYGIGIPLGGTYETAGGFALDCLQAVPEGQVTFRAHGYRITVTETEGYRIRRLRFEKTAATGTP